MPWRRPTRAWESVGAKEIRETRWRELLDRGLRQLAKGTEDIESERKSAPGKVALAAWLKHRATFPTTRP